jgi:hypothetical protein
MYLLIGGGALLLLFAVCGVGYLLFSGPGFGSVSGTVTLNNEPLGDADVVFIPEDDPEQAALRTTTNKEGKFKLAGYTREGVPTGKYKVTVSKLVLPNGQVPSGEEADQARASGRLRHAVHPDYGVREKTPLNAVVERGGNDFTFELKPKP